MPQHPILWMLVGLPGAGKTTYRKELMRRYECAVVSSDDIIEAQAAKRGMTYRERFDQINHMAMRDRMVDLTMDFAAKQMNIVIDRCNIDERSRAPFIAACGDHYHKQALIIGRALHEMRETNKDRAATGRDIPDEGMRNMAKRYQRPTKREGFDMIYTLGPVHRYW